MNKLTDIPEKEQKTKELAKKKIIILLVAVILVICASISLSVNHNKQDGTASHKKLNTKNSYLNS
ncbi:hypothetical protein C2I27_03400 [Priestia megaterium]|uniref:hypothetical protein n=1 Tax=Priestia megaterium TaxID=1404 RepID=UPI000D508E2C|nr:hypothetical protein [Priestia megaterium]PVC74944.1 hypothetical protein C2I27_03400 [Priestia megaterium]